MGSSSPEKLDENTIKAKISDGLSSAISGTIEERAEFYKKNPVPSLGDVDGLIQSCSNNNAMVSGAAGLIPGPLGMAAAIPEIILVSRNQINMIYDIGKAYEQNITSELLLAVLGSAMGGAATGLVTVQGGKIMARRAGARALQSVIRMLGGKITQQVAKSMAAKWIPLAGAVAMATWSRYSTKKIGEKAVEIFSKEIVYEEGELNDDNGSVDEITIIDDNTNNNRDDLQNIINKSKASMLINLMKIDGKVDDEEMKFIEGFIDKLDISSDDKMEIIGQVSNKDKTKVDLSVFKNDHEEALYLLIDLIALAKSDGEFHITEKMYIKEVAKVTGFSVDDMNELMAS